MNFNYLDYVETTDLSFGVKEKMWITFLGDKNKDIVDNLLFKKENNFITINYSKITNKNKDKLRKLIGYVSFSMLDIFLGERISDELAYNLESLGTNKKEMKEKVEEIANSYKIKNIDKSPTELNLSEKIKLSFARILISNPKVLVIDDIIKLLDKSDLKIVLKNLKNYTEKGGIILNFTTEIEETVLGDEIIITDKEKIILSGKTISVLNEEKLMKRLGYNLPFIVLLNKYLKDYELIENYILDYERLVDAIW